MSLLNPFARRRRRWATLTLLLTMIVPGAARAADDSGGQVSWFSIVNADGALIGYATQEVRLGREGRARVETSMIRLATQGGRPTNVSSRTVLQEDAAGRVTSISDRSTTGRSVLRYEARIAEGVAVVTRQASRDRQVTTVALPAGVRFDRGEALLRAWDPTASPRLSFEQFDIEAMSVERVVIEAQGSRTPDGRLEAARRLYDGDQLIGVTHLTLGREGQVVAMTQPMVGTFITIRPSDRETASRPPIAHRLLASVMSKSPVRISSAAIRGHIRYRFGFRDGMAFQPPQTGEQRVTSTPEGVVLDICETCGPGLASDAATLADARRATGWLQSDHRRLKAIAQPVAVQGISDRRKMALLTERTRSYLVRLDFTGHYSALDTLSRRAGDCTEAAVLLAALGRAAGIPTRVVNGLVYSRVRYHGVSNVFMPHSWVLAYVDGDWRSYDAALDGFDATHIALTVGDGDARSVTAAAQLASLLRWDGMSEVKTRPRP